MKELQRYGIKDNGDYYARADGEWVSADDAIAALEAAEAREAELRAKLDDRGFYIKQHEQTIAELRARVAELEAQVPDFAYRNVGEFEDIVGYSVNDSFRTGFTMARTTMQTLRRMIPAAPKEEV